MVEPITDTDVLEESTSECQTDFKSQLLQLPELAHD